MKRHSSTSWLLIPALTAFLLTGCEPPNDVAKSNGKAAAGKNAEHEEHGDHGHGPNGGHMVHLEPSGSHAEWTHDDETGKLTVYVSEIVELGKKVESVKVVLNIGDQPSKTFDFKAGEKSTFEITSPELLTAIQMTGPESKEMASKSASKEDQPKVKAKLVVVVDGKEQSAAIEEDDHHHHH